MARRQVIGGAIVLALLVFAGRVVAGNLLTSQPAPLAAFSRNETPVAAIADPRTAHVVVMVSSSADCGQVLIFNSRTGALLHTLTVGYQPSALALSERTGRVFITGQFSVRSQSGIARDHDVLSEVDVQSGRVLRSVTLPVPIVAMAVDDYKQRVITLRKLGIFDIRAALENPSRRPSVTLDIRDAHFGAPRRSIPVNVFPTGIAVDKETGHIFVADLFSDVVSIVDNHSGSVVRTLTLGPLLPSLGLAHAVMDQRARRLILLHPRFAGGISRIQPQITIVDTRTGRIGHVAVAGRVTAIAADQQTGLEPVNDFKR